MVENNVEEINKVQEIKKYLLKSLSHFGGAKFTAMMKELSNEEKVELFNDREVQKQVFKITDYEALASVFRSVPAEVQEIFWFNIPTQKVLLGLGTCSDQELRELIKTKKFFSFQELSKKDKKGKFYYNSVKLRALEVLLRYIKSPRIKEDLNHNEYYQMILLASKKVPDTLFNFVDIETLFAETTRRDFYSIEDRKSKCDWVCQINNICPKLLLPNDVNSLFTPTTTFRTYFYGDDKKILAAMLHAKIYGLSSRGKKLEIDVDGLRKLSLEEINVLKEDRNGVVNHEVVNQLLGEVVENSIKDGTIFSKRYLNTDNLNVPVQRAMFKIVIEKAIGNPQYEESILEYLYSILFTEEYNELEKQALMMSLKKSLLYADEDTVADLFSNSNDIKSVFFLRFNLTARNMDYLHGMTVSQLMRLNVKHINKIVQLLYDPEVDELSDSYSKAIKMYLVFGLEKTVELLSGKYPVYRSFMDNVSKLDVSKVEMKAEGKKYLPVIHEEFNRFMFAANNIDALFEEDNAISSSWYYLYNNFESVKELCHGHVTLGQAEIILKEQVNTVRYDLEPDCYRLEKVLYEAGLGNKSHVNNEEIYDEMSNIHRKQVRRVESTIPYVKGTLANGWGYEVMRHESPIAYVLGYRANCCIRTKDIAHNHLLHALLSEYGRILLVYKPDGLIASFSPLKRNGELIIANSIETISKKEEDSQAIIEAFDAGMRDICRVSKETEEKGCLKVATIGQNSMRKPKGEAWPFTIPTPTIYEKDDPVYKDTDIYHRSLHIFYKDEKANLHGLKYGEVKQKYLDPRKSIMACTYDRENVLLQRKALRVIDSVRYTKWLDAGNSKESFEKTRLGYYSAIFFNDDWYIIVDYYGIHSECVEDDPRARKEMEATIAVINDYAKDKTAIRQLVLSYNEKKVK